MNVKLSIMEAISGNTDSSYTLYHSPEKFVPRSDIAHFIIQ